MNRSEYEQVSVVLVAAVVIDRQGKFITELSKYL